MGKLTRTKHGDEANRLMDFYQEQANKLEEAGSYFMAAVALGAALETALLTYMLVEWGEENSGELEIPDRVALDELVRAAKEFDLLNAIKYQEAGKTVPCSVEDVIQEIQQMRNNIHPANALRKSFDPSSFGKEHYRRLHGIYGAVLDNLLHYL